MVIEDRYLRLCVACRDGRRDIVKLMLRNQSFRESCLKDLDRTVELDSGLYSPLHIATIHHRVRIARLLIGEGVDVDNATARDGEWKRGVRYAPLHLAAMRGDDKMVRLLLRAGAAVDLRVASWTGSRVSHLEEDDRGMTALHLAADRRNAALGTLLKAGANPNSIGGKRDETALHCATRSRGQRTVRLLLRFKADPNATNGSAELPLHIAAQTGAESSSDREILRLLIAAGTMVNARDHRGHTPLHVAAANGRPGATQLLLKAGAQVDARDNEEGTALHRIAPSGFARISEEVLELLLRAGADINGKDREGLTPLHLTASNANSTKGDAEILIKHGADPNATDSRGETPLHLAVKPLLSWAEGPCHALIEAGADINVRNQNGDTPLDQALAGGNGAAAHALFVGGAELSGIDGTGTTPLHRAILGGSFCAMDDGPLQRLIEAGVDVETVDASGSTLLHQASKSLNETAVKLLIRMGADVQRPDGRGQLPVHLVVQGKEPGDGADSEEKRQWAIFERLKAGGADVNAADRDGSTPLHVCVRCGMSPEALTRLVHAGCDPHARDSMERTPLHWAALAQTDGAARVLVGFGAEIDARDIEGGTPQDYYQSGDLGHLAASWTDSSARRDPGHPAATPASHDSDPFEELVVTVQAGLDWATANGFPRVRDYPQYSAIRELGERIYASLGFSGMQDACEVLKRRCRTRDGGGQSWPAEKAWEGIGGWRS